MQILVTVPGLKQEPIILPDNATVMQFFQKVYNQTGARVFGSFGFTSGDGATYQVAIESPTTKETIADITQVKAIGFNTYALPQPVAPVVTDAGTGGSMAANTYYTILTYVNPTGETGGSTGSLAANQAASVTILVNHKLNVPSPPAKGDATGYNVYMGTTNGSAWKLQNGSPIAIGTAYVQSTAILAVTAPPGTNTATAPVSYSAVLSDLGFANGDEIIFSSLLSNPL
jgi:hypothetical protein